MVADLVTLAETPAPTFHEQRRLDWIDRRLTGAPGTRRRDDAGNLIWRVGDGPPRLLLLAHVDTVFPLETPLGVQERGGFLHGPGVGDNAAAVSVAIYAATHVADQHPAPFAVAFTVAEEGLGNLRGAIAACDQLRPAMAIAVEGHGLDEVIVDAVGSARVQLHVTGPGGHSWWDRDRPSAIHGLLDACQTLRRHSAAVNVGVISGGSAVNALAANANALVEARSLDNDELEGFLGDPLDTTPPLVIDRTVVGRRPAGRLDRTHPLLGVVRHVRATLGLPDTLGAGSTDANAALAAGIPALTLGCARGDNMHHTSERIDAASLTLGLAQLSAVLETLLVRRHDDPNR